RQSLRMARPLALRKNLDELRWLLHRPQSQYDRIEDGKETGVQSDGGAEREQRDQRESGLREEIADRVAKILNDAFKPWPDPDRAGVLAGQGGVADRLA